MDTYDQWQNDIFRQLQDMKNKELSAIFSSFVEDMAKIGITLDQLIAMQASSTSGADFMQKAKAAAIARGATISGV